MTSAAPHKFTEAEYLALERASETKHEFVDGKIIAMAGARPPHNVLAASVTVALAALKEYVIVSHRAKRVDHHRRLESGHWLVTAHLGEEAIIELPVFGATVRLADLYAKVDLGEGRSGDFS